MTGATTALPHSHGCTLALPRASFPPFTSLMWKHALRVQEQVWDRERDALESLLHNRTHTHMNSPQPSSYTSIKPCKNNTSPSLQRDFHTHKAPRSVKLSNCATGHVHASLPTAFPTDPLIRGKACHTGKVGRLRRSPGAERSSRKRLKGGSFGDLGIGFWSAWSLVLCHFRLWPKADRLEEKRNLQSSFNACVFLFIYLISFATAKRDFSLLIFISTNKLTGQQSETRPCKCCSFHKQNEKNAPEKSADECESGLTVLMFMSLHSKSF